MLRGYRSIVAALGLILAANAHAKSSSEQPQTHQPVASSLEHIATHYDDAAKRAESADQQEAPCGPHQYGSDADLCAQWKAADSAADSAWWAWAGGIIGLGSLLGVFAAIGLAFHSNWIARDTAKRQLRAYVTVSSVEIIASPTVQDEIATVAHIKNDGETPAVEVEAKFYGSIEPGNRLVCSLIEHPIGGAPSRLSIGKGDERGVSHNIKIIGGASSADILNGDYTVFAYGVVAYKDIFGSPRN